MLKALFKISSVISCFVLLFSCNNTKYVGDDELLLTRNTISSTDPSVNISHLHPYLQQQPNTKWFSIFNVPLSIYSASGRDTTKFYNRMLRKWGEAPVKMDSIKILSSCETLKSAMNNIGYLDAEVVADEVIKGKKVKVRYNVIPNKKYKIRNVRYNIADNRIDSLIFSNYVLSGEIAPGKDFSVNELQNERKKITAFLNDNGYTYFNKESITYTADSCREGSFVDVCMNIGLFRRTSSEEFHNHPYYYIRNVSFLPAGNQKLKLRQFVLENNSLLRPGDLYKSSNIQKTYNKFAKLHAVKSTNIKLLEVPDSLTERGLTPDERQYMDAQIMVTRKKPHSLRIQPEGTNTAGDFGAALSLIYENRNIFHGSEMFTLQARGAFEAIKGLEGYTKSTYQEYEIEAKLSFPRFMIPGVRKEFKRQRNANSELILGFNLQNRPEFDRRLFRATWRYKWQTVSGRVGYSFDLLDINFVSMPWISETFKRDYLDNTSNRNSILRYNYEDLLIMKMGLGVTYSDANNLLKFNVETAGNLLYGASHLFNAPRNSNRQFTVMNIAFAQYVKTDIDYTHLFRLDHRNSLALHARFGIGIPYGNSTMLPWERRYFSGGANSVRGWSVRELGPGRYRDTDGRIDFINQTGDVKIDLNAELRTDLFWKFQGAIFIDAGNVWTIRDYPDQPGGLFTFRNFYEGMAVAYGIGLRLNFNFFLLRLDMGMKAINPAYKNDKEHFPIINPNFKRDYALHFAVGLPF